jgi:hypothetical protein
MAGRVKQTFLKMTLIRANSGKLRIKESASEIRINVPFANELATSIPPPHPSKI